ncbi:beta strand repeat-containing protein, partial [Agriterribacter humi]|uniref:beta strand repeat-containing protein n=1 Tax=Agriterribacter humi TaxID=1104781 RepID=UPI0037432978
GQTTRTISVNTAGTYTVTVTRNGCDATDSKDITVTTPPTVNLGADAAICAGNNITLDAGTYGAGTTYSWSNGATSQTITVSPATNTTYTVNVTRNGCTGTDSKLITVNTAPVVNLGADAAICAGSSIILDAGDPGAGTTYSWMPGGQTTRTISVNTAGTYTVTVTRNGCVGTDAKIITVNTAPVVNLGADAAICAGDNITLDAGDPGAGTTYSWSPDGATSQTITVNPGVNTTYTVNVTRNGCTGTDSKLITVNTPPVVNLGADASICAGDNITLDAGTYGAGTTYSWSNGATSQTITVSPATNTTYTVNVTRNGCVGTDAKIITVNTAPVVNLGPDASICAGDNITLDAGDPGAGATYNWTPGGATTRTISVNTAGTYTVTVTRNGCVGTDAKIITVNTPPVVNLGPDASICAGSSITLDAGDPGAGTTYSWTPGGATTRTISVNTAGTYTVTVTRNGCVGTDAKIITVNTPPVVNLGPDASICAGDNITLDAGDPGAGATYNWTPGGATTRTITVSPASNTTYTVNVTRNGCSATDSKDITVTTPPVVNLGADAAICAGSSITLDAGDPGAGTTYSWSTGATTRTITVNPATNTTYTVNVTRNGCTGTDSKLITVNTAPVVNLGADASICAGDNITLDAGDPGAGTTYSWLPGGQTTRTISVNTAGTYTVTVTHNGCSASDSKDITVATPPTVNLGADASICAGDNITLDAGDPGAGTTYSWSTGATTRTISVNTADTYTVTVTRNGCVGTDAKIITVNTAPVVNLGPDASICAGDNITLDAGDPGAGATYNWTPGGATTRTISVNTAGTYTVTVTRNGCSASDSKDITVTTPPVVNLGADAAICAGSSITLDAGDPGAGTTYSWMPGGATTRTITVNPATNTTYTVNVTRNGCTGTDSKLITVNTAPVVNLGADASICAGDNITLDAGTHGAGTTYSWSPGGATSQTITVNPGANITYTVNVTRNGCTGTDSKLITVNTAPVVNLGADAAICAGSSITLDAGDPGAGTTYSWSTGATTRTIFVNTAGTYTVTVTRNGCVGTDAKIITLNTAPVVDLGADAAICAGSSITLDAGDPGAGATYNWMPGGQTTRTISVNTAGTYTVTVTRNGCDATDSKDITVTTPP